MRQYEPIWLNLKNKKEAYIKAPIKLHPRIIQAVKKEKASDQGWKLLLSEAKERYELRQEVTGEIIKFYLIQLPYKPFPKLKDL